MSRIVRKIDIARRDLVDIFFRIALDSEDAAPRFLREANRSIDRLAAMPGIGARLDAEDVRLVDVRVSSVSKFKNILIYYRPIEDGIEILRILHAARDTAGLLEAAIDAPDEESG